MKYSILFMVDARGWLRMIVRYKGKRITYNVGFNVDTGKWNKETQRCKGTLLMARSLFQHQKLMLRYKGMRTRLILLRPLFVQSQLSKILRQLSMKN